jgi:hypothetical protein
VSRTAYPKLWGWFDRGLIVAALHGHGEFFIPGVTWRERHDRQLVLRQLILWADDREQWSITLGAVETALREAADPDNQPEAIDLAWAAVLVGDDMHEELLTDTARLLARDLSSKSGYPPETQAQAEALSEKLGRGAD